MSAVDRLFAALTTAVSTQGVDVAAYAAAKAELYVCVAALGYTRGTAVQLWDEWRADWSQERLAAWLLECGRV